MSKFHMISEKVIKINVGGSFYTSTKATLTKVHGSYIWRIFTGDAPCPRDERGSYFIDRQVHGSYIWRIFTGDAPCPRDERGSYFIDRQVHGSYIWRIFTGDAPCPRDERGSYFIDRDGPVFRYILNYLRSDRLSIPYGFRELDLLKIEAEYFGLDGLVQEVESILASRRRNNRRRQPARKKTSQSVQELHRVHERNGSLYISDEGSDWFYD